MTEFCKHVAKSIPWSDSLVVRKVFSKWGLSLALTASLSGCFLDGPTTPSPVKPVFPFTARVYFSQSAGRVNQDTLEKEQIYYLDRATSSIHMFMPEFANANLTDALIRAKQRGVNVQVATNAASSSAAEFGRIRAAGIMGGTIQRSFNGKAWTDSTRYLVIDQRYVWLNTSNLTSNDQQQNDNSAIFFDLPALAANYIAMFNGQYGLATPAFPSIPSATVSPSANPDFTYAYVTPRLAPNDTIESEIVNEINQARTSVSFLGPELTSSRIADALGRSATRGITVKGVIEKDKAQASDSQYNALKAKGLDLRLDGNPQTMNQQLVIIDGRTLLVGSYALQPEAKNAQSLLKIRDDSAIAETYQTEFTRVYEAGQ